MNLLKVGIVSWGINAVFSDFSSGCFTVSIRPENYIFIIPDHVKVGSVIYSNVSMLVISYFAHLTATATLNALL